MTESTALGERLDAESLQQLLGKYFGELSGAIERHGGTVEKFIGDAVMALFGIPILHEDDALRALRAVSEIRTRLAALNADLERDFGATLELRIGVATGEIVTGQREQRATGAVLNMAARLEQAARPGEVLIGEETFRLVRDRVEAQPIAPLTLRGISRPVQAFRLLEVTRGATGAIKRPGGPFVGRDRQLRLLRDAFDNAVGDRSCHLLTLLGAAGVGKSRLVAEFLGELEGATTVRGRCRSYGQAVSHWPLVEVVRQLEAKLPSLALDDRTLAALGPLLGEGRSSTSTADLLWGMRKLLEAAATAEPLVCVFEDVHWGEDSFLDLLDQLADLSRGAALLIVCTARPELLDRRPGWGGGKLNATSALLEPLSDSETDELIELLRGDVPFDETLQGRIREAGEGNPLFVEEMMAMLRDAPGSGDVPPTIQALLGARLDQLAEGERYVLECGSIEGRVFHRAAVEALAGSHSLVDHGLIQLMRKELIRPDNSQPGPDNSQAGADGFRFRHQLIRDAAYEGVPKTVRAELHERYADWLCEQAKGVMEVDEIVAYHLEQAYRYRLELGPIDRRAALLGVRSRRLLAACGTTAFARNDIRAAANLLERALGLDHHRRRHYCELLLELAEVLTSRADWALARQRIAEAEELGRRLADPPLVAWAQVLQIRVRLETEPLADLDGMLAEAQAAAAVLESARYERAIALAWYVPGWIWWMRCRAQEAEQALARSIAAERRGGAGGGARYALHLYIGAGLFGPLPVPDAIQRCNDILVERPDQRLTASAYRALGALEAMRGNYDEARRCLERDESITDDLGLRMAKASASEIWALLGLLNGDLELAEAKLQAAYDVLAPTGDKGSLSTVAALSAEVLYRQSRNSDALEWTEISEHAAGTEDIGVQVQWRGTRAKLLAHAGKLEEGERLAREAIALAKRTDFLNLTGNAFSDLAEVLAASGNTAAAGATEQALALYEQKGCTVLAARSRSRLADLGNNLRLADVGLSSSRM